jgi:hypothetical protein
LELNRMQAQTVNITTQSISSPEFESGIIGH